MQLSLRSAEWGALRIELVVKGSEVRASVLTECGAARDAIVSQLDDLRARLEGRGLRLGEFRVSVERPDEAVRAEDGAVAPRSLRPQVLDLVV
jgi:flagellar hook-length control protein FliK